MTNTFYITTAIDYPNGKPHMGHAFEKIITDVFARWHRQKKEHVFFSTGTDEHGQKIQKYAALDGLSPKSYVDARTGAFKSLYKQLGISYDAFVRTTDLNHEALCQKLFQQVLDKGDIYLGEYSGNYCIYDERFFTEKELKENNCCPECGRETQIVKEEAYFFKMSAYQQKIIEYIENTNAIVPKTRQNEILSRLKSQELKDLCVSRTSFDWGISLQNTPGSNKKHVIYVWFDALINYLSAINYGLTSENEVSKRCDKSNLDLRGFWPADIHVVGKDIIWFHAVIWPAMLMSLNIPLPKKIYAHGFILSKDGSKMSKSKGNVINPEVIMDEYGVDAFRYYVTKIIPSGDDGNFSEKELVEKYNNELGNDLGNLVMRCVKLTCSKLGNKLEAPLNYSNEMISELEASFAKADEKILHIEYDKALDAVWAYVKKINSYLTKKEPWKKDLSIDSQKNDFHNILYTALDNLTNAVAMLQPFIPNACDKISSQLGISISFDEFEDHKKFTLREEDALFPKIEWKEKPVFPLLLKVGEIIEVTPHPNATKLLVLKVDLGVEKRQLVAGLANHYSADDLCQKKVVVLTNLKPAKLRGVESQGMVLAGEDSKGKVSILNPKDSEVGSLVFPSKEFELNFSQVKIDDFAKLTFLIKDNKVFFESNSLKTDKEDIFVDLKEGKVY